jgi:hypothetical protein
MVPLHSFKDYLFNLETTSKSEAKRMWRKNIKDQWEHKCAYCESEENITMDHIIPQCKGGLDVKTNVIACCHSCNQSKGHIPWEDWYSSQEFFSIERYEKIKQWMKPDPSTNLFTYGKRKNTIK